MEMIRMYDTNEIVLVARKSNYQNKNIFDGYFSFPKKNSFVKMMGLKVFIYSSRRWMETIAVR